MVFWSRRIWIVSVFLCFSAVLKHLSNIEAAYLKKKYAPGLLDFSMKPF